MVVGGGASRLVLTSTGGGVNAAVVGWMLRRTAGAADLYEPAIGRRALARRAAVSWCASGSSSVLASLWWIVPLLVHVRYGIDFLQFTEQPGTIWGTSSVTEIAAADGLLDLVHRRRLRRHPADSSATA